MLRAGGPGPGTTFLLPVPLRVSADARRRDQLSKRMVACSPVAFNDIKHLARSMPADGLEAQDVVPPRCGCWVARMAIFVAAIGFGAKHTRSRAPSLATLPVITWRLRLDGHGWPLERCC